MRQYRRTIMDAKKRYGTARSLVHYRELLACYLSAKRIAAQQKATADTTR
jgi:hypothetical protein